MTDKSSVVMHMLNGHFEGEISCGQYGFSGYKWNPCLEVERLTIIQCKEALANNLN